MRIAYLLKRTGWQALEKENGLDKLERLLAAGDRTVKRLRAAHEAHARTVEEVLGAFESLGARASLIGPRTKDLSRAEYDLVVAIGGDGTLLRASHRVLDAPILGINSDPKTSVGFFCGVQPGEVLPSLERAVDGRLRRRVLTRMQVTLRGEVVSKRVLNDALFCHTSPAATSRYLLTVGRVAEDQKSSGFWIGPAAGSTAAQRSAGGRVLPLESDVLQLVVREPYTPKGERYQLQKVLVRRRQVVTVQSKMRESALFLDGHDHIHPDFADFMTFSCSNEPLVILGIGKRSRTTP